MAAHDDAIKMYYHTDSAEVIFNSADLVAVFTKWNGSIKLRIKNGNEKKDEMSGMNVDMNGLTSGIAVAANKSLPQSPASMVSSESETQSISDEQTTSGIRRVFFQFLARIVLSII